MNRFRVYEKGEPGFIATKLSIIEFQCRCKNILCNIVLLDSKLASSWNSVRDQWGRPIFVTSGHRCYMYNESVGGKAKSKHTKGSAIDLSTIKLSKDEFGKFLKICEDNFDVVIPYLSNEGKCIFLHCHNN